MNPNVLRRFVIYMGVALLVLIPVTLFWHEIADRPPGDYETKVGDIRLKDKKYDEALAAFDEALKESPNHRGAMMGRALVFIRTKQNDKAVAELTALIDFLTKTLQKDDPTGRATLAAAYANRGIVHDREGRYKKALEDYVKALQTDEDTVSGPGLIDKILYGTPRPSTVRKRAQYIYEQLKLPPEKRLMRVPKIDAGQRMHKP
ncbi:MAG: tetratricopeptide repeat protein [Pseudomonadota bacterium]